MAKKGGNSEISGFVSIKNDVLSTTKQKVASKNLETDRKSRTAKNTKKEELDDERFKSRKAVNKDLPETQNTRQNNGAHQTKSTTNATSKIRVQVSQDASKIKKSISVSSKDSLPKKQEIAKSKTNDVSKTRTSTEPKVGNRKVTTQDVSKSKEIRPNPSKEIRPNPSKEIRPNPSKVTTTPVANKNVEKNQKVLSKGKIKNDKDGKESKTKLESSKTEANKTPHQTKKTVNSFKANENVIKTSVSSTSKSYVSTKSANGPILNQKSVKTTKHTTVEKDKKLTKPTASHKASKEDKTKKEPLKEDAKFSKTVKTNIKVELPQEDLTVERNYKDLIYFEVDMGNSIDPSNSRVKSARIKSATSLPGPLSRQGTFTKDESPTSLEPEAQFTEEAQTNKEQGIATPDDYEVEYEDDFEDYESDFEEYVSDSDSESGVSSKSETDSDVREIKPLKNEKTSKPLKLSVKTVEEEKKLDSGIYDLSSKTVFPQSVKQKQLDQIREAISQENTYFFDENFRKKIPSEKTVIKENKPVVLDFISALKKKEEAKKAERKKPRSIIILEMINLHEENIDVFEDVFSDDDIFKDLYQNRNVSHVCTETDLLLTDEEVQTNEITVQNMWTQCPISYRPWSGSTFSFKDFLEEHRGYGGDKIVNDDNFWWNVKYNTRALYNFIDYASKIVLVVLEEEAKWRSDEQGVSIATPKDEVNFSDGCVPIQIENLGFLKDRPVCDFIFSPHDSNMFVSSHRFIQNVEKLPSFTEQFFGRSILCIWSILEPSQPLHLLVASCQICAITFDLEYENFIYAGLTDGSVCMWDLSEPSMHHKVTTGGSMGYLLRAPTFCTSYLAGNDHHQNVIVSMKSIGYDYFGTFSSMRFNPTQILTLDADGKVVLWILTQTLSSLERAEISYGKIDSGMSYWGKFKLLMGRTLNLQDNLPSSEKKWGLQFLCMSLAPDYGNETATKSILVGTNVGKIIHISTTDDEIDVPVFSNECEETYASSVMCIEKNPHGFPIFLTGGDDGLVRFYALDQSKPFKIISFDESFLSTPVIKIKWSPLGLGLFFVFDKNLCFHLWDLCKGENSPQISVSLKNLQVAHFDVTCDKKFVYIGMSLQRNKIDIHRLKNSFVTTKSDHEEAFFVQFVKCNSNLPVKQ